MVNITDMFSELFCELGRNLTPEKFSEWLNQSGLVGITPEKIPDWLVKFGKTIILQVSERQLHEAYERGKMDAYLKQIDDVALEIFPYIISYVEKKQKQLREENFYNIPSNEDIIQMRAYECLISDILPDIIKSYNGTLSTIDATQGIVQDS